MISVVYETNRVIMSTFAQGGCQIHLVHKLSCFPYRDYRWLAPKS